MTEQKKNPAISGVIQLVWALGQWNDHNWTHEDYSKWRRRAQELAPKALDELEALERAAVP